MLPLARAFTPEQQRTQALETENRQLKRVKSNLLEKASAAFLRAAVRHIHADVHATYGSRRMQVELNAQGFAVGRYKVRGLMQALQLKAKRPKQHRYPVAGKPSTVAPNSIQVIRTRIGRGILPTFAPTKAGFT